MSCCPIEHFIDFIPYVMFSSALASLTMVSITSCKVEYILEHVLRWFELSFLKNEHMNNTLSGIVYVVVSSKGVIKTHSDMEIIENY